MTAIPILVGAYATSTGDLREVKARKFAVVYTRGCIVCNRGVGLVQKSAKGNTLPVNLNSRLPLSATFTPSHAYVLRRRAFGRASPITHIFGVRAKPQIATAVIPSVMVDMVNQHAFRRVHDKAVHLGATLLSANSRVMALSVVSGALSIMAGVPSKLRQPLVIGGIYKRVQTLRKRYGAGIVGHRALLNSVQGRAFPARLPNYYSASGARGNG